ncbi:hypothetical protein HPB52_021221 [Rhipicephalus sanguineus]|uniref:Uncharacterized protein n=1 Tax=Rhipicephalus sanguineus TaxID=34632 RepID=A0A9D4Q2T6_RHISA|nr:hypothetical protein HPB52_021221 [Rhipicephalus sanguineus]
MDDAEDSADASEASPSTAVTEAEAANSVHPRARKRKRYLEPGQLCVVPRTTLRYQDINLKQCASGTNTVSDLLRTSSNKCCDPQHGSHIAASTSRDETENDTAVCNSSGDSQMNQKIAVTAEYVTTPAATRMPSKLVVNAMTTLMLKARNKVTQKNSAICFLMNASQTSI